MEEQCCSWRMAPFSFLNINKTYEGKDTNADTHTHTQSPRAITEAVMLLKDAAASLLSVIGQWLIERVRIYMHVYVCLSSRVCDWSIFFRIDRASCVGVRLCVYVFLSECSIATGSISSSNIFFSVTVSPDLTAHCVLSLHGCICFCVNKCTCKRDHVQYISVWAIWPLINSSIVIWTRSLWLSTQSRYWVRLIAASMHCQLELFVLLFLSNKVDIIKTMQYWHWFVMLWTSGSLSFLAFFMYLSKETRATSQIYILTRLSCCVNIGVRLITGYVFHIRA